LGGKAGMTVYFGEVHRSAASAFSDEHNTFSNTALTVRMPTEAAVVDVWTHRSLFAGTGPRTLYFGELSGVPWYEQVPGHAERLEMAERAQTVGAGLNAAPLPDVPEYPALIAEAFARLGWNAYDFTLHRLRVEYPAVATAMVVQFDLPAPPAS
ncbi:MAG TPA: hypothetical protein VFF65_10265, partial [Phycisphaerales bacterium]|nr:hypothetical protein [Phycisphaerales bacterium]